MASKARRRLVAQLEDAGRRGMCYVPADRMDMRLAERCVREGILVRPLKGMFATREEWESLDPASRHLRKMRALQAMHPSWSFGRQSAALAWGLAVSYRELDEVCVTLGGAGGTREGVGAGTRPRQSGICTTRAKRLPVHKDGLLVVPVFATLFDCASHWSFAEALVTADSALRLSLVTKDALLDYAASRAAEKGAARAYVAFLYADGRAESGGESLARATMLELGFAEPDLQTRVADPLESGRFFRLAFSWQTEGGLIGGELDGRQKYENPAMLGGGDIIDALTRERRRESRLSAMGVRVIRFSYAEICDRRLFTRLLETFGVPRVGAPAELKSARAARRLLNEHSLQLPNDTSPIPLRGRMRIGGFFVNYVACRAEYR